MKKEIRLKASIGTSHSQVIINEKQLNILENKKIKAKIKKVVVLSNNNYYLNMDIFYKGKKIIKNIKLSFENKDILNFVEFERIEKIKIKNINREIIRSDEGIRITTVFIFKIKN